MSPKAINRPSTNHRSQRCRKSALVRILAMCVAFFSLRSSLILNRVEEAFHSDFECSVADVCLLRDVFLEKDGTITAYVPSWRRKRAWIKRLSGVNLLAASQIEPSAFGTLLKLRVHVSRKSSRPTREYEYLTLPEPVFYHAMLAVGNFGHTLLQNSFPALLSMFHSPLKISTEFQTILANDCTNCGMPDPHISFCMNGFGSFGYDLCDTQRRDIYRVTTGYPAKYLSEIFNGRHERVLLKQVVVGFPHQFNFDILFNPTKSTFTEEHIILRERSLSNRKPSPRQAKGTIRVFVYCKDVRRNGRHGNSFRDCSKVVDMLQHAAQSFMRRLGKRTVHHAHSVIVTSGNFDDMTTDDQLDELQNMHVYISDGGSSSYYTHFLPHGAVSLTFPLCNTQCVCEHIFLAAYYTPGVRHEFVPEEHVQCAIRDGDNVNEIFKPMYDVKASFVSFFESALFEAASSLSEQESESKVQAD